MDNIYESYIAREAIKAGSMVYSREAHEKIVGIDNTDIPRGFAITNGVKGETVEVMVYGKIEVVLDKPITITKEE